MKTIKKILQKLTSTSLVLRFLRQTVIFKRKHYNNITLNLLYQSDSIGTDAFLTSSKAQFFGRGGFDADTIGVNADDACHTFTHGGDMRIEFGLFGAYGGVDIDHMITFFGNDTDGVAQDDFTVHVERGIRGVGEMITDVAHVGSAENGVADGVYEHICVAVPQQAQRMGYLDAAQPQVAAFNQLMDIIAHSYAYHWDLRFEV